jgi:hypothetical protein
MLPNWVYPLIFVWAVIAVMAFSYTWSKCGAKTLILGNGGLVAAATGLCD